MRFFYVFIFILLLPHMAHTYLYQAIVLRKWNDLHERYHYFIGLGDYHCKQHAANREQRNELEALLAHTDPADIKIFTEDLSVCNHDGRFGCGQFYVNSRGGFLGGITDSCRSLGMDVDNLEYRYARVCALGPILNNAKKQPQSFASVRGISVGQLHKEVAQECDRIAGYDDGPILNDWYKGSIEKVDRQLSAFGWSADVTTSTADYIMHERKRLPLMNDLFTFDCQLLDAKIVHETINNQDKERVYAIAGGSHVERASQQLQKVGYQPLLHIKPAYQGNGVEQCLQLQTNRIQSAMPEPISLDGCRL